MSGGSGWSRPVYNVGLFVLGSALFACVYCQAPLYYSNQNQYFLHGLAQARDGFLADDWLANTADPTPVFSALVTLTASYLHPLAFHVYHGLLLGIYGTAMLATFVALAGRNHPRWPLFLALFVAAHAGLGRWLSQQAFAFDYPWFLQSGVAGQYILGGMLQPSMFGVLLVAAIALFLHDRFHAAGLCIAVAATVHPTYLLPGAMLTLGFLATLLRERNYRSALLLGTVTLICVLPVTADALIRFAPTSAEATAQAQEILVHVRIPHHCRVDRWLDPLAGVQIAWVLLALVLSWHTRLRYVLGVPVILATLLTVVQVVTQSDALALLFPWRVSAVLVPLATTVILSRGIMTIPTPTDRPLAWIPALVFLVCLAGSGVAIRADRLAYRGDDDEVPLYEHIRANSQAGDVYLIPTRIPKLSTNRGSLSSDFKPIAAKKTDTQIIPVDLQRFRLHAGAPIYIDFKSIPYRDAEVLEWHARLQQAVVWQEELARDPVPSATLKQMRQAGITQVVLPAGMALRSRGVREVYAGTAYAVYRLDPE